MKFVLPLAVAAALLSGAAMAQSSNTTGGAGVSTAPTPSAPSGVTTNQGAGAAGMAASPSAPTGATTAPNPQAGTAGTQPSGQQGGSGSGSGG